MVRRRAGAVLLGDCISGGRDTLDGTLSGTLVGAPNGTLTDVVGLSVGHWTDAEAATGCTVVLCGPEGAVAGVDVRGSAPGTRETDLLAPVNLIDTVHAVLLSGGSAFGLDAAGGVMHWLEERELGCEIGTCRVPIVCAAVLFDLTVGRADVRPDAAAGYAACAAASTAAVPRGCVGAGTGASVGKLLGRERGTKSGLGSASVRLADGTVVAALVAVNAGGNVVDPAGNVIVAGVRDGAGGFLDVTAVLRDRGLDAPGAAPPGAGGNTTLALVATDAALSKVSCTKIAQMAHDGLARTIDPVHTMYDGDTVFALATGAGGRSPDVSVVGAVAARVLAEAVLDAARSATALAGLPSVADLASGSLSRPASDRSSGRVSSPASDPSAGPAARS